MSGGVSNALAKSKSRNESYNYTRFPAEFLADLERVIGAPISLDQLAQALPQSRSLFDSAQPSPSPFYSQEAPVSRPAASGGLSGAMGPSYGPSPSTAGADTGWRGGAYTGYPYYAGAPGSPNTGNPTLPSDNSLPSTQGSPFPGRVGYSQLFANVNPELARTENPLAAAPRAGLADAIPGGIAGAIRRTGIGDRPQVYGAPTVATSNISAPTAQAGLAGAVGTPDRPSDYAQLEQSIYKSQFDPVRRQVLQQQEDDMRALQAQQAQSGIAGSAAGAGLTRRAQRQTEEQLRSASQQAAQGATSTRLQYELGNREANAQRAQQTALSNAQNQQQTNLQNAGFDLQAQTQNAANVLNGNIANSEAYLRTIGLNQTDAQNARQSLLQTMQIGENDLARLDDADRQAVSTIMDAWLRQAGLFAQAGQMGIGGGTSSGFSVSNSSYGGASMGGGGGGGQA